MWKGPSEGPDGPSDDHSKGPEQEQELKALKEQLARLKGMVSKPDSTVTEEKVEEYAHTLTKMTLRAKRQKEAGDDPTSRRKSETPASEKVMLLRRQLEENKMRLAERGKSQKGMEEMVTQIRAQLDDSSQQLITQTPLNIPLIEDRVEYSPNTNPQELYNILLNKDKRISELNGKIGRLEANVLDLQENIKEKDSVIDARTKAITLMSENLSKKSKSTLDALDETKEQMRSMQENFVTLEEQMRFEKSQLMHSLEAREAQVSELEKRLQSSLQSSDVEEKVREQAELVKEKEKVIEALELMVEKLKRTEEDEDSTAGEIAKLKRQLDESNKNMIKVKAQHKSKVKELTKKVDQFKKLGDVHAEVVRLEAENSKYSQRIAELEEEKGQLQLAMVESKESIGSDDARNPEVALKEEIAEKIELVTSLENKNQEYEKQVAQLTEKLEMLTTMHTEKVTSDLTNAQYEEQLERTEKEKSDILTEKEKLAEENASLNEKIDVLKREKQEITAKLEGYVQENIDLMDRLEKLSAEKVSSAESIEIVENLTQQEKLELEAYQKSLTRKSAENLADNPELNESVNQLTEETSELIAKIELFTVERREVMEKMELLTAENNQLSLKLKEIENNRDVLVETYEQLQTEKEALDDRLRALETSNEQSGDVEEFKALIEIQKQEIQELKVQLLSNNLHDNNVQDFEGLKEKVAEYEAKLRESVEEVENYKMIIEDNKGELVQSSNIIADLQEKIAQKSSEIEHYDAEVGHLNATIAELNDALKRLEEENRRNSSNSEETVRNLSTQLEELKKILDENIAQTRDYERELDENLETTKRLNSEIKQLNNRIAETENVVQGKDDKIRELEGRLQERDAKFKAVQEELRSKCLSLQAQIGQNADSFAPLQGKIGELEKKNKEQLERMKKLAANLKKKTSEFKDLEEKHNSVVEKWELEVQEKETLQREVQRKQSECEELAAENSAVKERCSKMESDFAGQLVQYSMQVEDLQNIIRDYENQLGALRNELEHLRSDTNNASNLELSKKDEAIADLTERLESSQFAGNALQMKVHELEMYIESQESELEKMCSQVEKLEGRLAEVEELTVKLQRVESELEQKCSALAENADNERLLEERIGALMERLAQLEDELKEAVSKSAELSRTCEAAMHERDVLLAQLNDANSHLKQSTEKAGQVEHLERQNIEMRSRVAELENESTRLETALREFKVDRDRSEGELQEEFNTLMAERKALLEQVEVSREEIAALRDELKGTPDDAPITAESLEALLEELRSLKAGQSSEEMGADVLYSFKYKILKDAVSQVKSYGNSSALIEELETQVQDLKQRLSPPQTQHFFEGGSNTSPFDVLVVPEEEQMQQASTSAFFGRSESKDDPFDFVAKEVTKSEDSVDDLLRKIKTLEFMLYTVEKEKEAAVLQCQELSTELTRLVYDKERRTMSELESQILVGDDEATAVAPQRTYPSFSCANPGGNNDDEEPMKATSAFKLILITLLSAIAVYAYSPLRLMEGDHQVVYNGQMLDLRKTSWEDLVRMMPRAVEEDAKLRFPELAKKYGYPVESHFLQTSDGYILNMHRIPYGKDGPSENRPVVFLQHGILASSVDWIIAGPEKGLAYILADLGYDVWMGNNRGNRYSRNHTTLNPDGPKKEMEKYWDFSWHEIGTIDLPLEIDFALQTSGQEKLFYVGHSQGTTAFFVMCSEKPEYNNKIRAQFSLAPIAWMKHLFSPLLRLLALAEGGIGALLKLIGMYEFVPTDGFLHQVAQKFCEGGVWQMLCTNSLFVMTGFNKEQLNITLLPIMMGHLPAGASTKQLLHYAQEVRLLTGNFQKYDYGFFGNIKHYGSPLVPKYNVKKVTAPVYLFYSNNDWLSSPTDVRTLFDKLPNGQGKFMVADPNWNHLDYMFGIDANTLVYNKVISLMTRH